MIKTRLVFVGLLLGGGIAVAAQPDKPGCADDPLFPTRTPGYRIETCETGASDSYAVTVAKGPNPVGEGKLTLLTTAHGIAPARLRGCGVGSLAPVASNDGSDGRAKSRRVELVKR